ncbi:SIR2 family NAD-dependent protein deacylase [Nonomuraea sp. NPDC050394]|uniref:SIR2 family NAD-dependent protein deacylase n=1 Tax=Nonomuraea sp. NPDC050394 TaxID=3364363 RepID=UPI0037946A8F
MAFFLAVDSRRSIRITEDSTWTRTAGNVQSTRGWENLVKSIKEKECVPFLGAGASQGLPTGAALAKDWAERVRYPYHDTDNLSSVMQYAVVMAFNHDANQLKRALHRTVFSQVALTTDQLDIHHILARCDLPLYLTTNYDDFMVEALQRAGKRPTWNVSPWYSSGMDDDDDRRPPLPADDPTAERPLVFHLHGHHSIPHSMVLTEDDYIDFHVRHARDGRDKSLTPEGDRAAIVPSYVRTRLRRAPLLFLGYSLRDSTFWTLFKSLMIAMPDGQRSSHVCLQLDPRVKRRAAVREYLDKRLGRQQIEIFWMSLEDFTAMLDSRLRGT